MGEHVSSGKEKTISASSLEKYGYCPLSWWLSQSQPEPESEALDTGEVAHDKVAQDLGSIIQEESQAKMFESIVLWFAIAATLISVIGVSLVFEVGQDIGMIMGVIALIWILAACYFLYKAESMPRGSSNLKYQRIILIFAVVAAVIGVNSVTLLSDFFQPKMAQILQAISLAWLVAACYFLYHSLKRFELALFKRRKHQVSQQITYVDSNDRKPKLFVSEKYGLSGRPDYVLLVADEHIPVEIKTGRVPRGPLFSHILQVAAYCVLIEEEFGKPPSHGILRYGQTENEVEYDAALKEMVISKLVEMRAIMKTGTAHRNHNKPGKCRNCSRKSVCPERLN
ncbi:MAG: CRISPR-associated protein Cas4 [Thermoplasmata archaeon]|nr:CRISPR-associated protein Cas4 [Thermoplasmata archaeon]